jgi:hypothetical protein
MDDGGAYRAGPAEAAIGTIAREFLGLPSSRLTLLLRADNTEAPSGDASDPLAARSELMPPHFARL